MANCSRCGATIDDYGGGMCTNCEIASASQSAQQPTSIGTPADVPCQRCGMYLPPHELKMWNSRLYCSYCIMDVQDDERHLREAGRAGVKKEEPAREGGGGGWLPQGMDKAQSVCERCGRSADRLYTVYGTNLCEKCYLEGGGTGSEQGATPSFFAQIVVRVKQAIGMRKAPKIIALQKKQAAQDASQTVAQEKKEVFDTKGRKFTLVKK